MSGPVVVVAAANPPRSTVPGHRRPTGGAYRPQRSPAAELAQRSPVATDAAYTLSSASASASASSDSTSAGTPRRRMRTASMRFSRTDSTRMA
jgi:hypothetical protein